MDRIMYRGYLRLISTTVLSWKLNNKLFMQHLIWTYAVMVFSSNNNLYTKFMDSYGMIFSKHV